MNTEQEDICPHHGPDDRAVLASLIAGFPNITLNGLEETNARLMTRVESKYPMTLWQCRELVQALAGSYYVLEIGGKRIGRYETMYYDTPAFLSYLAHHNRKGTRYKLRVRHYDSSDETYLEVKKKDNKGSTEKNRMRTTWSTSGFLPEQAAFLRSILPFDCRAFRPVVRTVYKRFTLVSATSPERITFDTGISFDDGHRVISYPDLVIGEIKYEKGAKHSPALAAIHALAIRKQGFSKYCIGAALLYDRLKHNRFKQNLLYLSRLPRGDGSSC